MPHFDAGALTATLRRPEQRADRSGPLALARTGDAVAPTSAELTPSKGSSVTIGDSHTYGVALKPSDVRVKTSD
jgi:hypothetical protein